MRQVQFYPHQWQLQLNFYFDDKFLFQPLIFPIFVLDNHMVYKSLNFDTH